MARKRKSASTRRVRKLLPGYSKVKGSKRRVVVPKGKEQPNKQDPTGRTISRRQYENQLYGKAGFTSWSQYQRLTTDESYYRWVNMAMDTNDLGISDITAPDSEFNRLLAKAADDGFSHDAEGTFHDFLVYTGWRTDSDDWCVGCS